MAAPVWPRQRITTDDPAPAFIASGAPRAEFGRACIPDNGRNGEVFTRDPGYLGIDDCVSLGDGNISSLMRDEYFVAVLPPTLLANPNFALMPDGGFFAFRPGLDGLEPVEIVALDGGSVAARDLGAMAETRATIGADAAGTVLIADDPCRARGWSGSGCSTCGRTRPCGGGSWRRTASRSARRRW